MPLRLWRYRETLLHLAWTKQIARGKKIYCEIKNRRSEILFVEAPRSSKLASKNFQKKNLNKT